MLLRSGFLQIAQLLQEAADKISHSTVRDHLRDAVQDAHKGTGKWANYVDHTGDGASGDVIYNVDGDTMSAPYSIASTGSKQTASLSTDKSSKVIPVVTYKKQITEAATEPPVVAPVVLVESAGASFLAEIKVSESSRTAYPVKLISAGEGSSAHYPAAVLERDGPKVFKKGTLMFWNHPTKAEEAQRPEGDLNNLAAILTEDARWDANGAKGPGLYSNAKVMADYAQKIEERAPHIGLSIRAGGTGSGKVINGKPELKSIDYAESVDYVTKAGRGGMALAEAARDAELLTEVAPPQENEMTEEQIRALVVSEAQKLVSQDTLRLHERALRGDASVLATRTLSGLTLPEPSKQRVIDSLLERALPKTATGDLDEVKFAEAVNAEAKKEGAYVANLIGSGRVTGMGVSFGLTEAGDPAKLAEARKQQIEEDKALLLAENAAFAELTGIRLVGREEEAA